jgi:hypothetical protein
MFSSFIEHFVFGANKIDVSLAFIVVFQEIINRTPTETNQGTPESCSIHHNLFGERRNALVLWERRIHFVDVVSTRVV